MNSSTGDSGFTPVIVGLGELLWDMLPEGKQLGGAPANFAYSAKALGAQGVVASSVGSDQLGQELLRKIKALGLRSRYITIAPDHPTGIVDVQLDSDGAPQYRIHEKVAWDAIPATPELMELAAEADAVCFGSLCQRSPISRDTIRKFLKSTRPDCIRVFDVNLRQNFYSREIIEESLKAATVVKMNEDELPVIAGLIGIDGEDYEVVSRLLDSYEISTIALTKAADGAVLRTHDFVSCHRGHQVTVADMVGAGDAFTAALVIGMLRGNDLEAINEAANRIGSYVCTQSGATPVIPQDLLDGLFAE